MSSQNKNLSYSPNKRYLRRLTDLGVILALAASGLLITLTALASPALVASQPITTQTNIAARVDWGELARSGSAFRTPGDVADPLFNSVWTSNEGQWAYGVAWGDADGDGDLDLATNSINMNRLYLNVDGRLSANAVWTSTTPFGGYFIGGDIAWGDVDSDGDLDLAVGNLCGFDGSPECRSIYLYRNDGGTLSTSPVFTSNEADLTTSIAWGDYDGDGKLDLAVGNLYGVNRLYRNMGLVNDMPQLALATWSPSASETTSLAWADADGDGDLDLAVGHRDNTFIEVYQNNVGTLESSASWYDTSLIRRIITQDISWGLFDDDSLPDLAVGNEGTPSYVYRNNSAGGAINFDLPWNTPFMDNTLSVAWVDYDSDGDLDLSVGNQAAHPNRLYRNDGGVLIATFPAGEVNDTRSMAWGDYDGDGDLDWAVGNYNQPVRVYRNEVGQLLATPDPNWLPGANQTRSVVWGDYDNDNDLDLAVGNIGSNGHIQIYRNDNGLLTATPIWTSPQPASTYGLVWGDYDGDGDLDLAAANLEAPNEVYRNDGIIDNAPQLFPTWDLTLVELSTSVAWGDYDGDGDLDLAVGNGFWESQIPLPNRLYRNIGGGTLESTSVWMSADSDYTHSMAWGDYDGDGDLDLAAGNLNGPNRLYQNDGGELKRHAVWTSQVQAATNSVAWGDVDGDGDLDLAAGNSAQTNWVYRNDGGALTTSPTWSSVEADYTSSVTWGDYDGDGDLDLAAGNFTQPTRVYRNIGGTLIGKAAWSASESAPTRSVNWGDIDGDGDLDLAVGNEGEPNRLYRNGLDGRPLPGLIPTVSLAWPKPNANFYSLATVQSSPTLPITYTLFDPEGDPIRFIRACYSLDGGDNWRMAVKAGDPAPDPAKIKRPDNGCPFVPLEATINNTDPLTTSPSGATHIFEWNTFASGFFGYSDNVVFRLEAYPSLHPKPNSVPGPYQRPYAAAATFPFRVRGTQVRVVDKDGNAVENAQVYRNGTLQPLRTNSQGYLPGRGELTLGDQLVALQPITSTHIYTIYYTSAPIKGELIPTSVKDPGVQTLTTSPTNPLILFNLDISLEWDASNDQAYMQELDRNLRRASEILYDLSNGGVALGEIQVHQAKAKWQDANVVIYASNSIRPNADVGGVISSTNLISETILGETGVITNAYAPGQVRLGVTWGRFGNVEGDLGEDWARVLAHELGHYFLYLLDNYLGVEGDLVLPITCEGSAMADAYRGDHSEFMSEPDWSKSVIDEFGELKPNPCLKTLAEVTTGRSDWETITLRYSALESLKPGPPSGNPGPSTLPLQVTHIKMITSGVQADLLPTPFYSLKKRESREALFAQAGQVQGYLIKTQNNLDPTDDYIIALGAATQDLIHARGAALGDQVCVFDYSQTPIRLGCASVGQTESIFLRQVENWPPQVTIAGESTTNTLVVTVTATSAISGSTFYVQFLPDVQSPFAPGQAPITTLGHIPGTAIFRGTIPLTGTEPILSGFARVWVDSEEPITETITAVSIHEDWPGPCPTWPFCGRRYFARNKYRSWHAPVYSDDGGLAVFNRAQLLGDDTTYVLQTLAAPPEIDSWLTPVGQAYRISTEPLLTKGSLLFSYLERDVPFAQEDWLWIYYYAPDKQPKWQRLETTRDPERNVAAAQLQPGGEIYTLVSTLDIPLRYKGWNLFGYPLGWSRTVTEALASLGENYSSVYHYDPTPSPSQWRLYDRTVAISHTEFADLVNDLTHFEFGQAYWIHAITSTTLILGIAQAPQIDYAISPPATFYGEIITSTVRITENTPVTAYIDNRKCGETTAIKWPDKWVYKLQVSPPNSCAAGGTNIVFKVGDHEMAEKGVWTNSQAQFLSLSD